jgi:asparagine N-glycosylation enzyme membrane subunit Stt3
MWPYSVLFSLPLVAKLCLDSRLTDKFHRLTKVLLTFCVTILLFFIPSSFNEVNVETKQPNYSKKEFYAELDRLSENPVVIMCDVDYGPEILYYTKHSVVAAPYHRQHQGIASSFKVLDDKYNENVVKEILRTTNTSYIFIRKPREQQKFLSKDSSLTKMLIANDLPKWLRIISLPQKFDDVVLAKVLHEQMDQ